MAVQPLSIGDILMLSQQAWRIGRAFTQGKKTAPPEFAEVEREANGLSESLKLVAETLHTDGSVLSQAEPETRAAVNTILESAQKTLSDLESFVEKYQVIKKKETNGGFVVERSWSEVVIEKYKTFKWTTEGGDISELRNMLQMHTDTINLTMQALQSRSLTSLERTVVPMAENISQIHDRTSGDFSQKIDDLHRIITHIANGTVMGSPHERAMEGPGVRSGASTPMALEGSALSQSPRLIGAPPPRTSSHSSLRSLPIRQGERDSRDANQSPTAVVAGPSKDARAGREDSAYFSMAIGPHPFEKDGRRMDWGFESGSPPGRVPSIGNNYHYAASSYYGSSNASSGAASSAASSSASSGYAPSIGRGRDSHLPRRESSTLPNLFAAIDENEATDAGASQDRQPRTPKSASRSNSYRSRNGHAVLPPPAIPSDAPEVVQSPVTPSSYFDYPQRSRRGTGERRESRPRTANSNKAGKADSPQSPNGVDAPTFERSLFRNSAILCDVRGKLVEFAQHIPDEPDPRFNTEMKEACKECRICVIRKRENREHGGTKVITSVWALSEDGTMRLQQKLSDVNETVPYCSYFEPEKVSLPPSEGDIALKWHAEKWGDELIEEKKTNWVNYFFESENDAIAFQSAVFGRTLLGSYRTMKTAVVHGNIKGLVTFEEQFANIEMLRLWEDDGVSTPGAAGGVLALIHISSNFGEGWARWWINNSKQPVRIKEDGAKFAKIKGIDVTVVRPGSGASTADKIRSPTTAGEGLQRTDTLQIAQPTGKKIKVKKVTGVRIEFKTDEERAKFVSTAKRCQDNMIPLPEL